MKAGPSSRRLRRIEERKAPEPPVQEATSAPTVRRAPGQAAGPPAIPPPRAASPMTILPAQPGTVGKVDPDREPLIYSRPASSQQPQLQTAVVGREVIQRDVGFEFETGVPVKTTPSDTSVPYGVQLFEPNAGGWEIKSDNSKIEFVTEQVRDSTSGKKELDRRMDQIVAWAKAMCASSQQAGAKRLVRVAPDMGTTYKYNDESVVLGQHPLTEDQVIAAPQATGGVTLDKIPSLISRLMETKLSHLKQSRTFKAQHEAPQMTGDDIEDDQNQWMYDNITKPMITNIESQGFKSQDISYSVGSESLMTALYPIAAKGKVEEWLDQVDNYSTEDRQQFSELFGFSPTEVRETTRNLQGLLTLVISYLIGGSMASTPAPYSKAIATLMSRTNFYQLYRLLTARERKLFSSESVLGIAEMEDGPVFEKGFYIYNELKQKVLRPGPKRSEWITSIIEGTSVEDEEENRPYDMMSAGSGTDVPRSSSSMGALNMPDVNYRTNKAELAVLELRNIPKNQGIDDWKATAMTIFEMFRDINMTREQRLEEEAHKARSMPFAYRF